MVRIVGIVIAVALAAAVAAAVALAAQSPKALRASIFAAARRQHSVHYVEHAVAPRLRQTMVADVAGNRGIQKVTFTLQGKKGQFTVRVVKRIAYVRGNPLGLESAGLTAADAARYQGRWVLIPPSNHLYSDLAADVTMPTFLHDIYPRAPLTLVRTTIGSKEITGVHGINRESGITFLEALFPDSKLRPLGVTDVDKKDGFADVTNMSRWNEAVHVKAPAHAVRISSGVGA
jgi:hypothetical protein